MANLGKLVIAITATTKGLDTASKKARGILSNLAKSATSLPAILGGAGATAAAVSLGKIADSYALMGSQLEYVTGSAENAEYAQSRLYEISKQTGTNMEDNAKSLLKFSQASDKTGYSLDENLDLIKTLNSLMIMTGTSGTEASAALRQLGQAFTRGKLAGDEFVSISENAPAILGEMAKALGVTSGELLQMSQDGELTSEVMAEAFRTISESGAVMAEDLPSTIGRGTNAVITAFSNLWDYINDETGIIGEIEGALFALTGYIEANSEELTKWVKEGWDAFIQRAPVIWENMKTIGEAAIWVAEKVSAAINLIVQMYAVLRAEQDLYEQRLANARQENFIGDQLTDDERARWESEFGEEAPGGTTVINNNFRQAMGRSDAVNITTEQQLQTSRY